MIDWREIAFALALMIAMLGGLAILPAGAQEGQQGVQVTCQGGFCQVPIEVLRSLVQRATLCSWESSR